MAMARQADRILVSDEALIFPIHYNEMIDVDLVKLYVNDLVIHPGGPIHLKELSIDRVGCK